MLLEQSSGSYRISGKNLALFPATRFVSTRTRWLRWKSEYLTRKSPTGAVRILKSKLELTNSKLKTRSSLLKPKLSKLTGRPPPQKNNVSMLRSAQNGPRPQNLLEKYQDN